MAAKKIRIILHGALGDALLATPALKSIKENAPQQKIILYCQNKRQRMIFKNNPYITRATTISFWRNPISSIRFYLKLTSFFNSFYGDLLPTLFYTKNVKDLIADMYGVKLNDNRVQIFLSDKEDHAAQKRITSFEKPVIILHITSRTTKNQEWETANWEELITSMPEYTFIQIGLRDEKRIENAIDFRSKISIRESFGLIKHAKSFVGVNSFYAHASNAFDIPGVVIWGPASPLTWGHDNNINIYKPLRCSPCLDILLGDPCPYDKRCMKNISLDDIRNALYKQLIS